MPHKEGGITRNITRLQPHCKKIAFTLAEVLITIGIIGIVAALTIPTLIKNYQKKAWVNELKVAYATINQVFKLAEADDQVTDLAGTTLYQTCKGVLNTSPQEDIDACITEWRKYVKIIGVDPRIEGNACKDLNGKYTWKCGPDGKCKSGGCEGGTTYLSVHLLNSTHMLLNLQDTWNIGNIYIDVNGPKGPNTWGRDAFQFQIAKDGHLYAYGSKEFFRYLAPKKGIDPEEHIQQRHWSYVDTACTKGKVATDDAGKHCTGRVVEEGWVMNY